MTGWKDADGWRDEAVRGLWRADNEQRQPVAGWAKEYGSLTYTVVYNSGHMVPYNQPEPAYDLLLRLLRNESMIDTPLPKIPMPKHHGAGTTTIPPPAFWAASMVGDLPRLSESSIEAPQESLTSNKIFALTWDHGLVVFVAFLLGMWSQRLLSKQDRRDRQEQRPVRRLVMGETQPLVPRA